MLKSRYNLLILLLFVAGAFLRFYNFTNRLIFGPEQGMSFLTAASNLEKFSLLGETNLIRVTSAGHIPFHGAMYSYFLLPLLVIFNFRVLPVTLFFAVLNLTTAYILFRVALKLFGRSVAAFTVFYFLFNDIMIYHSLFAWIVNPTPLLGVLSLWYFAKLVNHPRTITPILWLGFMSGFGFGLQNFYLFFAILLLALILFTSQKKLLAGLIYLLGIILGSFPTFVFDIRHDFYHVRTYIQYFLDVLAGKASSTTTYYNFLFLYPFLFLAYGFISHFLYKIYKPLVIVPLLIFLYGSFTSPFFDLRSTSGMAPGITLRSLESAAALIAADKPPAKFNLATLWDFDTRANPLRYILQFYYHDKAQPYENYQDIDTLYVFSPEDYPIQKPRVWELQTFLPYNYTRLPLSVTGYRLYKLTKTK